MPLTVQYSDPRGEDEPSIYVTLDDAVRFGNLTLTQAALVGDPAVSSLEFDDPDGGLNIVGWRNLKVRETSAPSNNTIMWAGVIGDRRVRRADSLRTGAARRWTLDLIDNSWQITRRIFVNANANRPSETAGDRLRWFLQSSGMYVFDYGHVTYPAGPVMDAADYRGQNFKAMPDDIALASGYNYWVERNEAHNAAELFFMDMDTAAYASTLAISNVASDVDGVTTFAPYEDAELQRSPRRVAAGVYLAYANGSVYVRNETTSVQFANVDQTSPQYNVKTAASATTRATRFLNDHSTEEDRITCAIKVPAASVNALRAGHLVYGRFSHLPGYTSSTPFRVMRRTVIQEEEGGQQYYKIPVELSPVALACTPSLIQYRSSGLTTIALPGGTVTLTTTPTVGSMQVICMWETNLNAVPTGFTQVDKRTYTFKFKQHYFSMWYRITQAGDTNAVTLTGNTTTEFIAYNFSEWAICASGLTGNDYASGTGGSPSVSVTPGTGSAALSIAFAISNDSNTPTDGPIAAGGGFTQLESTGVDSGVIGVAYRIGVPANPQVMPWTTTLGFESGTPGDHLWKEIGAVFR